MNRYPRWKNLLILAALLVGIVYALPNIYGDDPAIQISATRSGKVDLALADKAETALKKAGLSYKGVDLQNGKMLIRLLSENEQLKAKDVLNQTLSGDYVVALNLAPNTPHYLTAIGAKPMSLGLDLRGGVYFLMQVDMDAVMKQSLNATAGEMRLSLRDKKIRYTNVVITDKQVQLTFRTAKDLDAAETVAEGLSGVTVNTDDTAAKPTLLIGLTKQNIKQTKSLALQQNITTLRNRINELGVAEPTVQQQGDDRIVVQLPGIQDTTQAKKILGATATLEFRLVDIEHDVQDAVKGNVPPSSALYYTRQGRPYLLKKRVITTGEHVTNARATLDSRSGQPAVSVTLDGVGSRRMSDVTGKNIHKPMAVVFIESKVEKKEVNGKMKRVRRAVPQIINVATIQDQLANNFQITGLSSTSEAQELSLLLRAGSLAAPVNIVEERTVGPSLGQDNINKGFESVVIGFVLVLVFMLIWYRLFGFVANLALAFNLVFIVALLSVLQATLTMPGIAGIVLTVGMAVDANVLIFERIREELRLGNSPQSSINAGYERAFATIADANVTTLIAAIVLFGFGSGTIKGFAVTLTLGIITSMFTAIMGTRAVINLIYGRKSKPKLSI